MMPQVVTVRVHSGQRRRVRLWISLLPVFLVLSPLLLLAAVILVVACAAYRVNPGRSVAASWRLPLALRASGSGSSRGTPPSW